MKGHILNLDPVHRLAQEARQAFYYYDLDHALERAMWFKAASGEKAKFHYAMKANSNSVWLKNLAQIGFGVDVVSGGELRKAIGCGFSPSRVIFSGVGKTRDELELAIQSGVGQINVESIEELISLGELGRELDKQIPVALRLNIHVAAPTHKNIQTATLESKFGIDMRQLSSALSVITGQKALKLIGLAAHVGSQIMPVDVFAQAASKLGGIFNDVKNQGFALERLDVGGGLGIDYHSDGDDDSERAKEYVKVTRASHGTDAIVVYEPGRFLIARSGVLAAQVVYVKKGVERQFLILNAGMNALMRPALYQAFHRIEPLVQTDREGQEYSVVGPICESTDVFAEKRTIARLEAGEWVVVRDTGAYGAVLANQYNESSLPKQWSMLRGRLESE